MATKKTTSKKAPSKKAPSKKAPSKKAPSKKAPSKKAPKVPDEELLACATDLQNTMQLDGKDAIDLTLKGAKLADAIKRGAKLIAPEDEFLDETWATLDKLGVRTAEPAPQSPPPATKRKGKAAVPRGNKDKYGFVEGSIRSAFANAIASKPMTMAEVKDAEWNPGGQTLYNAFKQLKAAGLAEKDEQGRMYIVK